MLQLGQTAPAFSLTSVEGQTFTLKEHFGKVILLEFWIRNCGACIASVPVLNALGEKFKDKGIDLLSINMNDRKENINHFVSRNKVRFPVLINGLSIAERYGIYRYPTVMIINRKGNVIYNGKVDHSQIEKILDKAIAQL